MKDVALKNRWKIDYKTASIEMLNERNGVTLRIENQKKNAKNQKNFHKANKEWSYQDNVLEQMVMRIRKNSN